MQAETSVQVKEQHDTYMSEDRTDIMVVDQQVEPNTTVDGATDVRYGGTGTGNRILVAAGGGGTIAEPVYHTHSSSCYATCRITTTGCWGGGTKNDNMISCPCYVTHSSCGRGQYQSTHTHPDDGQSHVNGDQIIIPPVLNLWKEYEHNRKI